MKLVLFGAGNIGRSFIAPLFAHASYQVVFVDINTTVVTEINRRGMYPVVTVASGTPPRSEAIRNVRALNGRDEEMVTRELVSATLAATAVGKRALPAVARSLAAGAIARDEAGNGPLDVILAENVRDCAALVGKLADAAHPTAHERLGLVETSIGKMVPIVPAQESAKDPLIVYAEPYNTLIVDKLGFKGGVPTIDNLKAVERIDAYVDRKLFVHNLGHAATAYFGFVHDPSLVLIAEAITLPEIERQVRAAMEESATALVQSYRDVFDWSELNEHIDDLVSRFKNRALGDTLYRVGRDLPRKLSHNDRIVGAMRMCAAHSLPFETIAKAYRAALSFVAKDAQERPFAPDSELVENVQKHGLDWALHEVSGLRADDVRDELVVAVVKRVESHR